MRGKRSGCGVLHALKSLLSDDWQRFKQARGVLSRERTETLDKLGVKWDLRRSWEEMLGQFVEYRKKYGTCKMSPGRQEMFPGLVAWAAYQRRMCKKGELEEGRMERLEAEGFRWEVKKMIAKKMGGGGGAGGGKGDGKGDGGEGRRGEKRTEQDDRGVTAGGGAGVSRMKNGKGSKNAGTEQRNLKRKGRLRDVVKESGRDSA